MQRQHKTCRALRYLTVVALALFEVARRLRALIFGGDICRNNRVLEAQNTTSSVPVLYSFVPVVYASHASDGCTGGKVKDYLQTTTKLDELYMDLDASRGEVTHDGPSYTPPVSKCRNR